MLHAHREWISSGFPAKNWLAFSAHQCCTRHSDSGETDPQGLRQHLIAIKPWWKQSIALYSSYFSPCFLSHLICIISLFFSPPCFLLSFILLHKHRDQCTGTAFGDERWSEGLWLISECIIHPSLSPCMNVTSLATECFVIALLLRHQPKW